MSPPMLLERPERRKLRIDPEPFELTRRQLADLRREIRVGSVLPRLVEFSREFHNITVEGAENLPPCGGVLIASNHPATLIFTGSGLVSEACVLTANLLLALLGRPVRVLASLFFYDRPGVARLCRPTIERLGYVPITVGNGVRLLEMGEPVLIYPEGQGSTPVYETRPFFWGFAKMAWAAGTPIIPLAVIGPHESRLRVLCGDKVYWGNNGDGPLQAEYTFVFLPEVRIRDHVKRLDDTRELAGFCQTVRRRIQDVVDRMSADRPLAHIARVFQDAFGTSLWKGIHTPQSAFRQVDREIRRLPLIPLHEKVALRRTLVDICAQCVANDGPSGGPPARHRRS